MFLSSINIKNFRSIKDANIPFNKGLNVIIGRNNTGKTAIIDALRICFSYGKQWRDIYINKEEDFYIDESNVNAIRQPIEFHLNFSIENQDEAGIFYELLTQKENGAQDLQLHFEYYLDNKEKMKWDVWGGDNKGQRIPVDTMSLIEFVYLSPLRDAVASLKPVRWNRIGELFAGLASDSKGNPLDDERRKELANKITNTVRQDEEWSSLIKAGKDKIDEHLKGTSIEEDSRPVELDFLPFEFRRIVDNIRMQLPVFDNNLIKGDLKKQRYFQISQNGLGYNNLIYIATVLGDLINKKVNFEPEAYYALLIEEPEAHLHPQLQNLFFRYMNKLENKGIQLFITSHSPTITSKVGLDSLIVLQKKDNTIIPSALKETSLDDNNKKYLFKFLDVTKSQLFFANGVILVEGISEALLLPIFAKKLGYDLLKSGIEIVNIGGVAFEHFAKLFNNKDKTKNLVSRCSIITDNDKDMETEEILSRAKNAEGYKGANLDVFLADKTFEKELYDKNEALIKSIYEEMHKKTTIDNISTFLEKLKSFRDKSELAHRLAIRLEEEEVYKKFAVPEYFEDAFRWVVYGTKKESN
jgi:putative ATP-dependent endonuclease of OLD family